MSDATKDDLRAAAEEVTRDLLRSFDEEQSERYRREIAAPVTPEHEAVIRAWFAMQEARERMRQARAKREEKEGSLADLHRPSLMN